MASDTSMILHRLAAVRADLESLCDKPQFGGTKEQLRTALANLSIAECAAQRLALATACAEATP